MKTILFSAWMGVLGPAVASAASDTGKPAPTGETVTYRIDSMMCGSCTSRVSKLITSKPGTSNVAVELDSHLATFTCDKSKGCDTKKIEAELQKIGYRAKAVEVKTAE